MKDVLKQYQTDVEDRKRHGLSNLTGTELSDVLQLQNWMGKKVRVFSTITNKWRTVTLNPHTLAHYLMGDNAFFRVAIDD